MTKGKGLIRSQNRKGSSAGKSAPIAHRVPPPPEGTVCERCGAMYARRTWRRDHAVTHAALARARWAICPGCQQTREGEYHGRVLLRGAYVAANEEAIRRRIQNVVERARFTQPERRLVSVERQGKAIEVLTTSQKLAHRVVHELKKAFRGRASYRWSDRDGSLLATWERDDVPS